MTTPTTPTKPLNASVDRDALLAGLRWTALAVAGRPVMQVLSGVLIEGGSGVLRLSGFDYEVNAVHKVLAPGAEGRALVVHSTLANMIASFPKGTDVRLESTGTRLTITGGEVTYRTPCLPIDDYPALPEPHQDTQWQPLNADALRQSIAPAVAAGRDDTLPILTGLFLHEVDGRLTVAATDRYRLGVQEIDVPWTANPVIVPARTYSTAVKALGKGGTATIGVYAMGQGEGLVWLRSGDRRVGMRLMEGEFPKYRSLVPSEFTGAEAYVADLPRAEVITAVKQARIASGRAPVRITLGDDTLAVECGTDVDSDTYARAVVHGVKVRSGKPGTPIGMNEQYLIAGCNAFTGEQITVSAEGRHRPHVFRNAETPGFTYLLMPVRMSEDGTRA